MLPDSQARSTDYHSIVCHDDLAQSLFELRLYTHCQRIGWVEPPGPAFGRPDDKLGDINQFRCRCDGFRKGFKPTYALPERWSGLRQETADPFFEHLHQDRIHEFVVIGNVEANDRLPFK